jgi:hypothetical protein
MRAASSVAYPAAQYFSTLSNKRQDFRKMIIEYEMCVLIFSTTLSSTFLVVKIICEVWSYMCNGLNVKYPLFLLDLNDTRIFPTDFRNIEKYQISWKSFQWDSNSIRTDTTKLVLAFRNFANAPNYHRVTALITSIVIYILTPTSPFCLNRELLVVRTLYAIQLNVTMKEDWLNGWLPA